MKERNGWGKDPRENRRTGSWPTAAFCPLFPSLIGARYLLLPFACMGKKERKEWTKAIDIVNDRIFLRHHSSINPRIIWFLQLCVLFDSLRGFTRTLATVWQRRKWKKVVEIRKKETLWSWASRISWYFLNIDQFWKIFNVVDTADSEFASIIYYYVTGYFSRMLVMLFIIFNFR